MGLLRGLVFRVDGRAIASTLGIAGSVAYALLAAAVVVGVQQNAALIAPGADEAGIAAVRPGLAGFDAAGLPGEPILVAAQTEAGSAKAPFFVGAIRQGDGAPAPPIGAAWIGPEVGPAGARWATGFGLVVTQTLLTPIGGNVVLLHPADYDRVFPAETGRANVAFYVEASGVVLEELGAQGFETLDMPAARSFLLEGAAELVGGVVLAGISSAMVVAFVAAAFVSRETESRRPELSLLDALGALNVGVRVLALRSVVVLAGGVILGGVLVNLVLRVGSAYLPGPVPGPPPAAWSVGLGGAILVVGATACGWALARALRKPLVWGGRSGFSAERTKWRGFPAGIITPRPLATLALSSLVLFATVTFAYGVLDTPRDIFGTGDTLALGEAGTNPLQGVVNRSLGLRLSDHPTVGAASAEIYAPLVVHGEPVLVRGADAADFLALEKAHLVRGRLPGPHEALVGERAASQFGLSPGDPLLLPGAYRRTVQPVLVAGIFAGAGVGDDEIVVPIPVAAALTGVPPGTVHIVRFRGSDPGAVEALVEALGSVIEIKEVEARPERPLPNAEVEVVVRAANFGPVAGQRSYIVRVNGAPAGVAAFELSAFASAQTIVLVEAPAESPFIVSVNPTITVPLGAASLTLEVPDVVAAHGTIPVIVRVPEVAPSGSCVVEAGGTAVETVPGAIVELPAGPPGSVTIAATCGSAAAFTRVLVVDPADLYRPRLITLGLDVPNGLTGPVSVPVVARVMNVGGALFAGPIDLAVDGVVVHSWEATITSGVVVALSATIELGPGEHEVRVALDAARVTVAERPAETAEATGPLQATVVPPPPPGSLDELIARKGAAVVAREAKVQEDLYGAFLEHTFGNVGAALLTLTLAATLHSGLAVFAAYVRESEERRFVLGTYVQLGASSWDVLTLVLRDALLLGAAGALIGAGGAAVVTLGLSEGGLLRAFGHTLTPDLSPVLLLRVGIGLGLLSAALAVVAARQLDWERPHLLVRAGARGDQAVDLTAFTARRAS